MNILCDKNAEFPNVTADGKHLLLGFTTLLNNVSDLTDKFRHWINLCETAEHAEYTEGNATHQPDVLFLHISCLYYQLPSHFFIPHCILPFQYCCLLLPAFSFFVLSHPHFLFWTVIMNLSHSVVCNDKVHNSQHSLFNWRCGGYMFRPNLYKSFVIPTGKLQG
jgi:hypothetical protein